MSSSRFAPRVWAAWFALLCASFVAACGTDGSSSACADPCVRGTVCSDGVCVDEDTGSGEGDASDDVAVEADVPVGPDTGDDTGEPLDAEPGDVASDIGADASGDASTDADADVPSEDAVGDTAAPDLGTDPTTDTAPTRITTALITAPSDRTTWEYGTPLTLVATVSDTLFEPLGLMVRWSSDIDGVIYEGLPDAEGTSTITVPDLSVGTHVITIEVVAPDSRTATDTVRVGVCGWNAAATFDTALPEGDWLVVNDAYRDERGWLEMTGNVQGRRGAIANVARPIAAGDVRLRFRVATGQCNAIGPCSSSAPGADGFAVSIFDVRSSEDLLDVIASAAIGGGLGYGIAGGWGTYTGGPVDGFHIEFDTWFNRYNGSNEFHTDPTEENHIAVTLNGNPGEHVLWAPYPTLEDNAWHDIDVAVLAEHVTVTVDGAVIIDEDVDGLRFKGGYLVFTGTTGFYTNYHRFDELEILEDCRFD